jgi:glutamate--cysteine ligase
MTTPLPTEADDPGAPIQNTDELIGYFASAEKPRDAFRVGTEHEKFGFVRDGLTRHKPLPFDGPNGIEAILEAIAAEGGWVRAQDASTGTPRTIALFGKGQWGDASITLEPGGQVELSGAPVRTVHETCAEVGEHLQLLRRICIPRGVGFIGMGFHPTARYDEMPLVPKSRYAVMTRYMPTVGKRGLDMMKRTATVQANYDWLDERDLVASYQVALLVSPLVAALFASSPFVEGKPSGAVSERQRVWADTDPNRAGFPPVILAKDFSYARYVEWALDVPMYFVRRDGVHHDVAGASFRTFMSAGLTIDGKTVRATLRDFADHMTTVFPEVRMKKVLEVRSADCGAWSRICALPALYKGILYDLTARDEARALMDGATSADLVALRADVAERGYQAPWRGKPVLDACAQLVAIATRGLQRIGEKDTDGTDESRYLRTLVQSVSTGETFAERLIRLYETKWNRDLSRLWDEVEFFHEDETIELVRARTKP